MYKRYRDLILGISAKDFSKQKIALEKEFKTWKRNLEQLDDVCIIALSV